jgi:plastocyanin
MSMPPSPRRLRPTRVSPLAWSLLAVTVLGGGEVRAAEGVVQGTVRCHGVADCTGAIVYVDRIPGRQFSPGNPVVMDQVRLRFVPYVLPVLVGTTVVFPNSDEVRHNVFSPSAAKRFNLGTYPQGVAKQVVFDMPGVVELLCNVHPEMSAYILVIGTPYSATVDRDGSFTLTGLPAGTYTLVAWRPQMTAQPREVTVTRDATQSVQFDLRR